MNKIKNGDTVIVIAGRDKGRIGKIINIDPVQEKVRVEGINMVKKNLKPNPKLGKSGGIVEKEAAIAISNIAVYNPITKKADKVGIKTLSTGEKARYYKSNDELIDV